MIVRKRVGNEEPQPEIAGNTGSRDSARDSSPQTLRDCTNSWSKCFPVYFDLIVVSNFSTGSGSSLFLLWRCTAENSILSRLEMLRNGNGFRTR